MSKPDELAPRPARGGRDWTRPEDYLDLERLRRRSAARSRERRSSRTGSFEPRFSLGMLPFLLLMAGLALLAALIIVIAWPGRQLPARPAARAQASEPGTAPPGWLEDKASPAPAR